MKLILRRGRLLVFILLSGFSLAATNPSPIGPKQINVNGRVPVRFSPPVLSEVNGHRSLVTTGRATPGTVIMLKGRSSILVPANGRFKLNVRVPGAGQRILLQAVSPRGERTVYAFNIPRLGPSPQEIAAQKDEAEKKAKEAEEEAQKAEEEKQKAQQLADDEKNKKKKKLSKKSNYPMLTNEFAVRTAAMMGTATTVLGVAQLRFWPTDIFGIRSDLITKNRLGFGGTYGKSLTGIEYDFMDAFFYYRVYPGRMNRATTVAVSGGYSSVTHLGMTGTGLSGGLLIGTTSPDFVTDLFAWLPALNVPQYLELEASIASIGLDAGVAGSTVQSSIRNKFFTSEKSFFDTSLFFRSHSFQKTDGSKRQVTAYGIAVGMGILF